MCLTVENKQNHFNSIGEMGGSSNFCGNCINHKTEEKVQSDSVTLLEISIVLTCCVSVLCFGFLSVECISSCHESFVKLVTFSVLLRSCVELSATVNMSNTKPQATMIEK